MKSRFNKVNKICVAVKFDDSSKHAVKVAEQVCLRTGAAMHLVHVCENVLTSQFGSMTTLMPLPIELLQATQENMEQVAESNIRELAKTISSSIEVSKSVSSGVLGKPADLIEAEALTTGCSMIIVGTAPVNHRFVPRGFSCALTLMSQSKLPIMAVNSKQKSDLKPDRLEMLISDDLKENSLPAIQNACRLAFDLKKTNIHHIHINGITVDSLEAVLNTAVATSHSQSGAAISAKEIYASVIAKLQKSLEGRTMEMNATSELSDCRYKSSVVTEYSVSEGLERFAADLKPNLVAFGRHHRLHHGPFTFGQMPHYAMMNFDCPVVVFPSAT